MVAVFPPPPLTFAIMLFAFSSIIYNYYLGETALKVMTSQAFALHVLRLAHRGRRLPWRDGTRRKPRCSFFSDPLMGVLAVVNLMAIMMLFPVALRVLNDFRSQLKIRCVTPPGMFQPPPAFPRPRSRPYCLAAMRKQLPENGREAVTDGLTNVPRCIPVGAS